MHFTFRPYANKLLRISPEKSLDSSIGEQAKDKQQLKNGSVTANPIPDMINEGGKSRTIKLDL